MTSIRNIKRYGEILGFDQEAIDAAIQENVENEALAERGCLPVGSVVIVRFAGFGPVEGTVIGTGSQGGALVAIGAHHCDAKPEWVEAH